LETNKKENIIGLMNISRYNSNKNNKFGGLPFTDCNSSDDSTISNMLLDFGIKSVLGLFEFWFGNWCTLPQSLTECF
jgi:hypothetical protein